MEANKIGHLAAPNASHGHAELRSFWDYPTPIYDARIALARNRHFVDAE